MRIEYRTIEGEIIERYINPELGVTINDIDCLAMQYLEKTNRMPDKVFLSYTAMANILKSTSRHHVASTSGTFGIGMEIAMFQLSDGAVHVDVIQDTYIQILVGSQAEFEDNNIHKIFEEIVLKDCERV